MGETVWQFIDKYSWVEETFPGKSQERLLTAEFEVKPAHAALKAVLKGTVTQRRLLLQWLHHRPNYALKTCGLLSSFFSLVGMETVFVARASGLSGVFCTHSHCYVLISQSTRFGSKRLLAGLRLYLP